MKPTAYDGATTSDTQPRKNMTTMGKIDSVKRLWFVTWVVRDSCVYNGALNVYLFQPLLFLII